MPTAGTLFAKDSYTIRNENLDLVFARSLIIDQDFQIRVNTADDLFFLGQDLGVIRTLPYDYVFIDCPPSIGKIIANTLVSSDFLIIPSTAEFFSTSALKDMMELIDVVHRLGDIAVPYRILITLFEKRNRGHKSFRDQLRSTYGSDVFETIIEVDILLRQAAILGFPTESSHGVEQYRKLVDELMEEIQQL
jgi:chromosome partitioning protein